MAQKMESNDLASFLFEIASGERRAILASVTAKPLKHAAIARLHSMTGSETTRHLNRLTSVGLVVKNPRGEHELTTLGRAVCAGLPLFDFLHAHHQYVLDHNILVLEPPFVERLGELTNGIFIEGTYQVIAVQEEALRDVRHRAWVLTQQRFEQALPVLREKAGQGADVRVIRPAPAIQEEIRSATRVRRNFPVRLLERVDFFLAVLDGQAGICFPTLDGRVDMAEMILLRDPRGVRWAEDLFAELWSRSREWRPALSPDSAKTRDLR